MPNHRNVYISLATSMSKTGKFQLTPLVYPIPIDDLTREQKSTLRSATVCHMCEEQIVPDETKVHEHCHLTGRYRGRAHQNCNINYQDSRIIPVVFHNLTGYDAHFIIHEICTEFEGKVDLLLLNKEKYFSLMKHVRGSEIKFRFIDSFGFMASSLEKLALYLENYKIVYSVFSSLSQEKI